MLFKVHLTLETIQGQTHVMGALIMTSVKHKTIRLFGVYLRSDDMSLDESTMTYSCRPLPQATYEVILPHSCSIRLQQKYEPLQESNPEPLCTESSPVTASPGF